MKWREDKAENATIRKMWRDFRERPFVKMLIEESARKRANNMRDHPVVERLEQTGEPYPHKPTEIKCRSCGGEIPEGEEYFEIKGIPYCERCAKEIFGRTA